MRQKGYDKQRNLIVELKASATVSPPPAPASAWNREVRLCEFSRDSGNVDLYAKSSDSSILTSSPQSVLDKREK